MNISFLRKKRMLILMCVDAFIMLYAAVFAFFTIDVVAGISLSVKQLYPSVVQLTLCSLLGMILTKTYSTIWRYATPTSYLCIALGILSGTLLHYIILYFTHLEHSDFITIIITTTSILGVLLSRLLYNLIHRIYFHRQSASSKSRTLIVGAGDAGFRVLYQIKNNANSPYLPVGVVDDDDEKNNRYIEGIPVLGKTSDILSIVQDRKIQTILIAIPTLDASSKKRILSICAETICEVKILPSLSEIPTQEDLLSQVKKINIEDLLGREVIKLDCENTKNLIASSVCMVTGGGGSIGSELCRQIAAYNPKKLIIVDVYENNAYDIQQELISLYGDKLDLEVHISSVRDTDKMDKLFKAKLPQIVFHAAAHKHVPLMETDPEEAVKNNVRGTYVCAWLAKKYKAEKFVLVSTDKAVNPTNVMGATKRCCEMIMQYMAQQKSFTTFVCVRFGNVLGSNGSVIPLFEKQIAQGGPVTVTHPEIIRYFMTIPEAVSLILQAGSMARGGEIFVFDMGEPVKILTLAENLIKLHGKEPYTQIEINFSGLRPGEKLYEELLMSEEGLRKTQNDKIFIGKQIDISPAEFEKQLDDLFNLADQNDSEEVVNQLKKIVPTFCHETNKKESVNK